MTTVASATATPTTDSTPDPLSHAGATQPSPAYPRPDTTTPAAAALRSSSVTTTTTRPTTPFERDFLASVRLNYLHVLFLLRLVFMNSFAEPDAAIVELSEAILELVVDVVLVRDRLANSGTNLSWKVC